MTEPDELATVAVLDLALVRRFGGLDAIAERVPEPRGRRVDRAARPPRPGADQAEAALAHALPPSLAAAHVALLAAGPLERAEAEWTRVADSARAAGELKTLRLAVALRAIVRVRQGVSRRPRPTCGT